MPNWAQASCTMTPTGGQPSSAPIVFTLPGFSTGEFDPNVPNGKILVSRTISLSSGGGKIKCSSAAFPVVHRGITPIVVSPSTYASAIPGIGMRFRFPSGTTVTGFWPTYTPYPGWGDPTETSVNTGAVFQIDFVKTGPITAGGTIEGEVAGWFGESGATQIVSVRIGGGIVVEPKVPTCRVTTPAITVPLGNMPASTFNGVGTVSPSKPFNIVLQCSGGDTGTVTNVHTTLTDHNNPGNVSDTLSLAPDATASGLGIQVLNGSTVIKYGPDSSAAGNTNQWKAGTTGNGTFTIPLTARYIQTAPKITPGTADGLATFTMSYQ